VSKHTYSLRIVKLALAPSRGERSLKRERTRREKLETMAAVRRFVVPVIMVFLVFSAAVAATVNAARPLAGDEPSAEATAGESVVSRFLRQRLRGPSHSCQTWNPNGGC
jgi:hypothetical protein